MDWERELERLVLPQLWDESLALLLLLRPNGAAGERPVLLLVPEMRLIALSKASPCGEDDLAERAYGWWRSQLALELPTVRP
jgi:hypothetical protein